MKKATCIQDNFQHFEVFWSILARLLFSIMMIYVPGYLTCLNINFTLLSFSANVLSPAASLPKTCSKEKEGRKGVYEMIYEKNRQMLVGLHDFHVTVQWKYLQINLLQAMSSAPQLPTPTLPQKEWARMEVVWILKKVLLWRRPLPSPFSILHWTLKGFPRALNTL